MRETCRDNITDAIASSEYCELAWNHQTQEWIVLRIWVHGLKCVLTHERSREAVYRDSSAEYYLLNIAGTCVHSSTRILPSWFETREPPRAKQYD